MTLRSITIPKAVVPVGSDVFAVSGVTANQVFTLYRRHSADLSELFDRLSGRGEKPDAAEVMNSIEGIIAQFPLLVGEAIAMAAGDAPDTEGWDEAVSIATKLPLPVQIDALMKIGELTFSSDMPPKKFFALLVGMIQQFSVTPTTSETGLES